MTTHTCPAQSFVQDAAARIKRTPDLNNRERERRKKPQKTLLAEFFFFFRILSKKRLLGESLSAQSGANQIKREQHVRSSNILGNRGGARSCCLISWEFKFCNILLVFRMWKIERVRYGILWREVLNLA